MSAELAITDQPMVTFLFSDDCPHCEPTLREVWAACDELDLTIYARKPTAAELSMPGFGFPALVLPVGLFGVGKVVVITGTKIADAVRSLSAED